MLAVPEIRDYHAINGELVRLLDAGHRVIRLSGVRGHRLLAAGLAGPWPAVIQIDGHAGPELAAGLDAPELTVVCRGGADDGAASRMRAGRVLVLGDVGVAFGYAQDGGLAVVCGDAGARAGLGQSGGDLVLLGSAGPMAGERQSGGRLFVFADRIGPQVGRARRGGRLLRVVPDGSDSEGGNPPTGRAELIRVLEPLGPCLRTEPGSPAGRLLMSSPTPTNTSSPP